MEVKVGDIYKNNNTESRFVITAIKEEQPELSINWVTGGVKSMLGLSIEFLHQNYTKDKAYNTPLWKAINEKN